MLTKSQGWAFSRGGIKGVCGHTSFSASCSFVGPHACHLFVKALEVLIETNMDQRRGIIVFTVLLNTMVTVTLAKRNVACWDTPPGIERMVRGVDINELDVLPLNVRNQNGYKMPVIEFTCKRGEKWRDGDHIYQKPDQVWHVTRRGAGILDTSVNVFKSDSDIKSNMAVSVGLESKIKLFAFSGSGSYSNMQNKIANESRRIAETSTFDSFSVVDLKPQGGVKLDPYVEDHINREIGNDAYESNPEVYHEFIKKYGTHYFESANFGGVLRMVHETSSEYFKSHSQSEYEANVRASYSVFMKARGGVSGGETKIESTFSSNTRSETKYYGGSANLLDESNGIARWQETVDDDPWLYSGRLASISDLIKNPTVQSGMEQAVMQHTMRAYLGELWRKLMAVTQKIGNNNVITKLNKRTGQMMELPLGKLVEEDVDQLMNDIEYEITVPDWFTSNTELCFKWKGTGDASQCGEDKPGPFCAKTGAMTPEYRDDTHSRKDGGCKMQWGITAHGHDAWFDNVKICFRYQAEEDGGQCEGEEMQCVPVNQYTSEYTDNTDNRRGGCKLTWRIVTPWPAPVWMRTTQFCFNWRPEGDERECKAPSREMCADSNSWLPWYTDDSDNRRGGCRMSWGLQLTI